MGKLEAFMCGFALMVVSALVLVSSGSFGVRQSAAFYCLSGIALCIGAAIKGAWDKWA